MLNEIVQLVRSEPWQVAIELLVIWTGVWLVFRFLRGTRGAGAVRGFVLLVVLGTLLIRIVGSGFDALARLTYLYDRFLALATILLVVVFQPELRQAMIRLGRAWSFGGGPGASRGVVEAIAEAAITLSKQQYGALIAIERSTPIGGLIETSTLIDAKVSSRLLESIFWPNNPLHDLGVIVRGDRIVAASVQFPLVEEGVLPGSYGSRHRAGVGVTLECDCLVVIVSEESGTISVAEAGRLEAVGRDRLAEALASRLRTTESDDLPNGEGEGAPRPATPAAQE